MFDMRATIWDLTVSVGRSVDRILSPFWQGASPVNLPCTPRIGLCLQMLLAQTKVQVWQVKYTKAVTVPVVRRRRLRQKTKHEEPAKKQVNFACQPEHLKQAQEFEHPESHRGPSSDIKQSLRFGAIRQQNRGLGFLFQGFMQTAGT